VKILPGEKPKEYILEFDRVDDLNSFFADAEQKGSFLLEKKGLSPDTIFRIRACDSPRSRRLKPVNIVATENGSEVVLDQPASDSKSESQQKEEPASLREKIRDMSVSEKAYLAVRADLMERRFLMKETNPKIQEFLLRNARITEQEVAFLAKNAGSPLSTILFIANNKAWMSMQPIRVAILMNPKTPPAMVKEMVPTLQSGDLIKMANARYLREDVQGVIRAEIKRRGIKVKQVAD
jgi:hypothetical protein